MPTDEPGQAEQVTVTSRRPGYRLGAGDKVHVTVFGEKDLTGDFEVSGNGHIAFPLIGDVTAAGLTAPGLGRELSQRLSAGYLLNPRVAVEVSAYRPFYVVGQVHKPGGYPYTNGMTVMNAIALAGGFTPYAYEGSVHIRHEDQAKEVERPADASTIIKPGDVVRVSESGFWSVMDVLTPVTRVVGAARYGFP
jgi:polysaccharide export outer membrane protein